MNEYVRVSPKKFELVRMDVELRDYLQSLGIDVLPIPDKVEGVPVFNLGLGNIFFFQFETILFFFSFTVTVFYIY